MARDAFRTTGQEFALGR